MARILLVELLGPQLIPLGWLGWLLLVGIGKGQLAGRVGRKGLVGQLGE